MAYKSKFLHFKTKASYEAERAKTTAGSEERKVFDAYISFIDEGPTICTWGKEYQCDANSLSVLPQELTTEEQNQVFKNLGWNVHIISQSDINANSSPSNEEKAKRLEATALLVKETSLIYVRGKDDSANSYFFRTSSSTQIEVLRINTTTGIIYPTSTQFIDTGTIRFDRTQTLSDSNKTLARENIDAANKNDVLPLTIDLSSQTVEDYNTALEAFNSKKPLTIFDSTDPTARFTASTIGKETNTDDIDVYFSFTGINNDGTFNTIGYNAKIKPTGEKIASFAAIQPSNMDPKPLGQASPGIDNSYSRSDHVHPAQVDITGNAATATTATNLASAPSFINNGNIIKITVGNKTSTEFTVPYASKTSAAEKLMYGRKIFLNGDVTGSTTESFNGSKDVTINTTISTINAEKLTGTINADRLPEIPISKIPAAAMERLYVVESQSAAMERLYVVESQSAAMSLTIQEGDVVQIGSGGPMYFCVSESASTFATKFKVFTAGAATSVPWSGVTNAPTKLSQFTNDSGFTTNKGTVTSVAMSVPTGLSISGSPITASGTLALSYTSGYSIPTTAKQTNWDAAYGWGNHASAGYAKTTQLANYLPLSGGTLTGNLTLPSLTLNGTELSNALVLDKAGTLNYETQSSAAKQLITTAALAFWTGRYGGTGSNLVYCLDGEIASKTWVQGRGYLTSVPAQTWASITGKPTFATVATSGSYNDLTNKPTIPSAYTLPTASATVLGGVKIGSGISISSGVISATYSSVGAAAASHTHTASQVTGLATVATSGNYNDLTNKPSIPSLSGYATQSWVTSQGYLTSIPVATSSAYGGIQIGYTTSGKNYAVQLSNGKAYVNVPWTDTNTTYSAGTNISISGTTINCTYSYSLPTATSSVLGGVKIGSNITVSSGTISLSKSNVTSALGYTPSSPLIQTGTIINNTITAGYAYDVSSAVVNMVSGFSESNPDAVVATASKITSFPSECSVMDGIMDLNGSVYVYCFTYIGGTVYINGAVYA